MVHVTVALCALHTVPCKCLRPSNSIKGMIAHSATPILSDLLHKKIVKLLWKSFEIFGYVLRQLSVIFGQLSLLFKLLYVYRNLYLPTTVMTYIVVFV